ncbi:MAG: hypothetical protein V4717_16660 [Bacteroidota bacterium]
MPGRISDWALAPNYAVYGWDDKCYSAAPALHLSPANIKVPTRPSTNPGIHAVAITA